jgi:hypothetical protein
VRDRNIGSYKTSNDDYVIKKPEVIMGLLIETTVHVFLYLILNVISAITTDT